MATNSRPRVGGFTLVELLVVITIIGMLVGLLLPAVMQARARMRQAECANNLRQIGIAALNYESSKQQLPGYVQPVQRSDRTFVQWYGPGLAGSTYGDDDLNDPTLSRVSWAAKLLSELDRRDIWDRIVDGSFEDDPIRPIDIFTCPDDTDATSTPDNAALTYVANTGSWDWQPNATTFTRTDLAPSSPPTGIPANSGDWKPNGLFFNKCVDPEKVQLTDVVDGAATTLMFSENIHKNDTYSWFGVSGEQCGEQQFGMVWVLWNPGAGAGPLPGNSVMDQERFSQESISVFEETIPRFARPASNHPSGSFNVIFADGHGQSMQPDLDYVVYQQLMTAVGSKCRDPENPAEPPAAGSLIDMLRRAPPVSEADYN